jgi:hypothetical protein
MNGKVKILFFCMIFVAGQTFSQKNNIVNEKNLLLSTIKSTKLQPKSIKQYHQNTTVKNNINITSLYNSVKNLLIITPAYYTQNFGFFCKKELAFEKVTGIPFRFRLGGVEQCDYLEGKNKRF